MNVNVNVGANVNENTNVGPSLLARVQSLIERTYAREELAGTERFVIGDAGLRSLYGIDDADTRPMLLVRCVDDIHRVRVYFPDRLIANLEAHDPSRGLSERNLHDFAAFVEEIDHLLAVVAGLRRAMPVRAVELELHANVTKALVLSLFLARTLHRESLSAAQRAELRFELFGRGDYASEAPALRERYRDARRHALRFLTRLDGMSAAERPALLRAFSRAGFSQKLALCA